MTDMNLTNLFNELKVKRQLRMIDQSPIMLRSSHEHGILQKYIAKVKERNEGKTMMNSKYSILLDKEINSRSGLNSPLAYDCNVEDLLRGEKKLKEPSKVSSGDYGPTGDQLLNTQ